MEKSLRDISKMTTDNSRNKKPSDSLKVAGIIACAFFYFLIFAQFAYLHLLNSFHVSTIHLNSSLLSMCSGGIMGCTIVAFKHEGKYTIRWLLCGFVSCAIWPHLVWFQTDAAVFPFLGFGTGLSLGILTVTIASTLHFWLPKKQLGIWVGGGVGLAYFLCNIPLITQSSAKLHCLYAVGICLVGLLLCKDLPLQISKTTKVKTERKVDIFLKSKIFWVSFFFLMILVWFDSAAFILIQNNFQKNSNIVHSEMMLWSIALLHFLSAIIAGWLLGKRLIFPLLIISLCGLLLGMWGIQDCNHYGWKMLYIISASIYSTILVALVSLLPETPQFFPIKIKVALLFAVVGWLGSTIGIFMVYNFQKYFA